MKVFKIKNKQFNLDALKGYSKTKFIKGGLGTESDYDSLEKFIAPKRTKKEKKEND